EPAGFSGQARITAPLLKRLQYRRSKPSRAPELEIEKQIADIWKSVLGQAATGVNDIFFEVGGDSILAVTLVQKIKERLNYDFDVTALFRYPSIRAIGAQIAQMRRNAGGDRSGSVTAELSPARKDLHQQPAAKLESTLSSTFVGQVRVTAPHLRQLPLFLGLPMVQASRLRPSDTGSSDRGSGA
uniref:phosphopantetheine-binding protein n=1 Tax=Bradyrhizobium sp. SZCCHNRI2049 TaxID=3057287 RepID=UPI0029171096